MKLTERGTTALWISGGKDSLLLLECLLRFNLKFSLLCFDGAFSLQQKKIIGDLVKEKNLLIYSYPPNAMTLIGDGEEISLAQGFAVDKKGSQAWLVSDLVDGTKCAFDLKIKLDDKPRPPVVFDTHIWGSKKSDKHWAGLKVTDEWNIGDAHFAAPLADWTDEMVLEALNDDLKLGYAEPSDELNSGNTVVCHNCLKPSATGKVFCPKEKREIPVVNWNPRENWRNWQC